MVTHDQEEALTMADRIVVMDNGIIEQVGTPEDIYGQPKTAFVADFIGTMNFIPGTITGPGTLTIGPSTLQCDTEKFNTGDRITVAIRPEDINAQDITTNDYNVVGAEIRNLEFMGSY
jgi:iron(III) transport system ATP-binding protein